MPSLPRACLPRSSAAFTILDSAATITCRPFVSVIYHLPFYLHARSCCHTVHYYLFSAASLPVTYVLLPSFRSSHGSWRTTLVLRTDDYYTAGLRILFYVWLFTDAVRLPVGSPSFFTRLLVAAHRCRTHRSTRGYGLPHFTVTCGSLR